MSSIPPVGVNIPSLALYFTVAGYLNFLLLGILATQVYIYHTSFPRDLPLTKTLVYAVFICELAQSVLVGVQISMSLPGALNTPGAGQVDNIGLTWLSVCISGGLVGGAGQLFFVYRIWKISGRKARAAPLIITILSLASIGSSLGASVAFFKAKTFSVLFNNAGEVRTDAPLASVGVWNGLGALCDITIALVMPYFLMRHGTGLRRTHTRIVSLVALIVQTGLFTTVVAIFHLCLYFAASGAFLIPGLVLGKCYANTILAVLVSRASANGSAAGSHGSAGSRGGQWRSAGEGGRRTSLALRFREGPIIATQGTIGSLPSPGLGSARSDRQAFTELNEENSWAGDDNASSVSIHEVPSRPRATIVVGKDRLLIRLPEERFAGAMLGRKSSKPSLSGTESHGSVKLGVSVVEETYVHRDEESVRVDGQQ